MELSINEVWEQAVTLDQSHGVDAVTVATTRMIEDLKASDHNAAAFWSAVANRLIEIQKIKMNIMPTPLADGDNLAPFVDDVCTRQFPITSANQN